MIGSIIHGMVFRHFTGIESENDNSNHLATCIYAYKCTIFKEILQEEQTEFALVIYKVTLKITSICLENVQFCSLNAYVYVRSQLKEKEKINTPFSVVQ